MADVKALAIRAAEIRRTGNALNDAQAIGKAILGQGIRNQADVKRLMSQVGTQLARDKRDTQRTSRPRHAT